MALISHQNFFIREERRFTRVDFNRILYIEACKNYVYIHLDDQRLMSLLSIKRLEECLPSHLFARIHRSFLVPLARISFFDQHIVCIEGKSLPLGDKYRDQLFKKVIIITSDVRERKCFSNTASISVR